MSSEVGLTGVVLDHASQLLLQLDVARTASGQRVEESIGHI